MEPIDELSGPELWKSILYAIEHGVDLKPLEEEFLARLSRLPNDGAKTGIALVAGACKPEEKKEL